jgi:hypothetical protein
MMELVDMNSLGLFDNYILSVQVGFTLKATPLPKKLVEGKYINSISV